LHEPIDPRWPQRFRSAQHPIVGMTRAMVVGVWGYPRGAQTVAELSVLHEWTYDVFDSIEFRGDRVSSVRMTNQP
jgi:hypothetical protein